MMNRFDNYASLSFSYSLGVDKSWTSNYKVWVVAANKLSSRPKPCPVLTLTHLVCENFVKFLQPLNETK